MRHGANVRGPVRSCRFIAMGTLPLVLCLYILLPVLHIDGSEPGLSAIRVSQVVAESPLSEAPDAASAGTPEDIYGRINKKVKVRKARRKGKVNHLVNAVKREVPVVLPPNSITSLVPLVDPTVLTKSPPPFEGNATVMCMDDDEAEMVDRIKVWQGAKMGEPRILCLTYTISTKHDTDIRRIRRTWGAKCDGYLAMSNVTDPSLPSVDIKHEGPEAYENMWAKVQAIWTYVHRHHFKEYDYFIIGGDDLFVVVENLRLYLQTKQIREATKEGTAPVYLGRRFKWDDNPTFNSGGAGYVLNGPALDMLVKGLQTHPDCQQTVAGFAEDYYTGSCLSMLGVEALNTQDSRGRDRFMPFDPAYHLSYRFPKDESDWYVEYTTDAGSPAKEGIEGVSPYAITFHYVEDELMDRMYAMLYGTCDKHALSK